MMEEKNYGKDAFLLASELEDKLDELNSRMLNYDKHYAKILKINYSDEVVLSGNLTLNLGRIKTNNELICAIIAFKINDSTTQNLTVNLNLNNKAVVVENYQGKSQKSILVVDNIITEAEAELKVDLTYTGSATKIKNINLMLIGSNVKFNKNNIVI